MSRASQATTVSSFGTPDQIKSSIRHALPFAFAGSDAVEASRFREKYSGLMDFASQVSKSPLQRETTRYQTNHLYLSLIFAGVVYFRPQTMSVKPLGELTVDIGFLVLFSILVVGVGAIFLVKALLDYQSNQFQITKNYSIRDYRDVILIGMVKGNIDRYYWDTIFDAIQETRQSHDDALSRALGSPSPSPSKHISMTDIVKLDIDDLQKTPEFRDMIAERRQFLDGVTAELRKDQQSFTAQVEGIFSERGPYTAPRDEFDFRPLDLDTQNRVREVFSRTLEKWIAARGALAREQLRTTSGGSVDRARAEAAVATLARAKRVKTITTALEVIMPLSFAAAVLTISWIGLLAFK